MPKSAEKSEPFFHDIFDETTVTEDGILVDMILADTKSDQEGSKSVIPLLRNKEAFKKKGYKTKGSYFAECERNPDTGGCLPKGEQGHGKLADPTQQTTPGISDETLQKLSKIGGKTLAKSKELRDLLKTNWNKLPKSLRYPVAATVKLLYSGYYLGNKAVKEIGMAKGLKEEDAVAAARLATAFDFALGGGRAAAVSALLGFPELSPVAAMLPIGSLSYLAFSTAKNPLATLKATKNAVQAHTKKKSEGIKHFVRINDRFWEVKYSPDQPRGEKGTEEGGQFIEGSGTSTGEGKLEEKQGSKKESDWKSKAKVKIISATGTDDYNEDVLSLFFGDDVDIASALGAPDDSIVKARVYKNDHYPKGTISCEILNGPIDYADRSFDVDKNGDKFVENNEIQLIKGMKGKGIGTDIFSKQVENCAKAGISYIKCEAAGNRSDKMFNGYYSWPLMGYDGPIPDVVVSRLPNEYRDAKTVQDIISKSGGREWWKENGSTFQAKFDLKDGSRSRQILDAYLEERKSRIK